MEAIILKCCFILAVFQPCLYYANTRYYCNEAESCKEGNLTELAAINDSRIIVCNGYSSCEDAVSYDDIHKINCFGSYSCNNLMEDLYPSQVKYQKICRKCYGLYSCANNELWMDSSKVNYNGDYYYEWDIRCNGELSCYGIYLNMITINSRDNDTIHSIIECGGDASCSWGDYYLIGNNTIYFDGNLAGENSIFSGKNSTNDDNNNNNNNNNMNLNDDTSEQIFHFRGANSGQNVTILCGIYEICYVFCYSNGCNNLKVGCADGSTNNCEFAGDCFYNGYEYICDDSIDFENTDYIRDISSFMFNFPDLTDVYMSGSDTEFTYYESLTITDETNGNYTTSFCDDYLECSYLDVLDIGPVVCSASKSCINVNNISIYYNNENIDSGVSIRCDGYASCINTSFIIGHSNNGIYPIHNAHIYFAGSDAANMYFNYFDNDVYGIIATTWDEYSIKTNYKYNIYCTAKNSCADMKVIKNANDLYCVGSYSCENSDVIDNINNVYIYGMSAATWVQIANITQNVYCGAYQACYGTNIDRVSGNVYGKGYQALAYSWLSDIDNVLGYGTYALQGTYVSDVDTVLCDGSRACSDMEIQRVHIIKANGTNVLINSTITTSFYDDESDRTLTFFLYSEMDSPGIYLTCEDGDLCSIVCTTTAACLPPSLYLNCTSNPSNCEVTAAGETIITITTTITSSTNELEWIYYILSGICILLIIITILSLFHRNEQLVIKSIGCRLADGVDLTSLWIYGLQLWDFFSDIYFAYSVILLTISQHQNNLVIFTLAILSPLFIILPYFANVQAAITLYSKVAINNIAQLYFESNFVFFCCLVVLSGGVLPSLKLINSNLFGIWLFDCGLNKMELALLKKLQVTHSVLLENAPQLILQIIYIIDRQAIDNAVIFALISSFFSVIIVVFTYFFTKQINFHQTNLRLKVDISPNDMASFNKNKGYRTYLSKAIANRLGIMSEKIEIYSIVDKHNGCIIYISYGLNHESNENIGLHSPSLNSSIIDHKSSLHSQSGKLDIENEDTVLEMFKHGCEIRNRRIIKNSSDATDGDGNTNSTGDEINNNNSNNNNNNNNNNSKEDYYKESAIGAALMEIWQLKNLPYVSAHSMVEYNERMSVFVRQQSSDLLGQLGKKKLNDINEENNNNDNAGDDAPLRERKPTTTAMIELQSDDEFDVNENNNGKTNWKKMYNDLYASIYHPNLQTQIVPFDNDLSN